MSERNVGGRPAIGEKLPVTPIGPARRAALDAYASERGLKLAAATRDVLDAGFAALGIEVDGE